jgi:hypothetical protein
LFNWKSFLTAQGVPFIVQGAKELSVHCPFCGTADHGEHLSISLSGRGWRCLRNPRAHSGRSRSRLIQGLLNVSQEDARRLAGEEVAPSPADEDLPGQLAVMMGDAPAKATPTKLQFPVEFKPLTHKPTWKENTSTPFWSYLFDRGYPDRDASWLSQSYNLHYATRGPYRYRLIIPVYDVEGALKTWTARSILPDEKLRYKTLSASGRYGPDEPVALGAPTNLLLGSPLLLRCPNPEVLVLCEGPFDAFRITALGRHVGVYGTCLFGLNISDAQINLLERLMVRFRKLVLLLDPDQEFLPMRVKSDLAPLPITIGKLPAGVEDPGALSYAAGRELVQSWL